MNLQTQFAFEGKLRRNLIIGMAVGALCLVLTFFFDDPYHTRFWTNFLHNAVFFTGIAFAIMFFLSASITGFSGWIVSFKRVWEAMSQFMWVGLILLGIVALGVWGHVHHLYHWNTPGIYDPASPVYDGKLAGKSGFLSPLFYTVGVLGFLGIWYFWAFKMRKNSIDQDTLETPSRDYYKRERRWAASFLPLGGFLSTVFFWLTMMSIDSHWYSTMFAWYSTISVLLAGLALTILLLLFLKGRGYFEYVTREHLHDINKFIFGMSVFWTYLWFDQFMLIWYANIGEETIYFKERMNNYPVLFWGNLIMNFVAPFFILMRNDTKRKAGTMFIAAVIVFFGHWWDFFYMIKPGARIAAEEATEMKEGKHKHYEKAAPIGHAAPENGEMHGGTAAEGGTVADSTPAATEKDTAAAGTAHETGAEETGAQAVAADAGADAHGEHPQATHEGEVYLKRGFKAGFTLPGFLELGTLIGFLSLYLFFFFNLLQKAPLLPKKDPYLDESLHHSTGVMPEDEENAGNHH